MTDHKNTILAIILSALVLIGWQYFYGQPSQQVRVDTAQQQAAKQAPAPTSVAPGAAPSTPGAPPSVATPGAQPPAPATSAPASVPRAEALAASPRVPIVTDNVRGSIALKGGRIDDLALIKYRTTVDPKSPPIFLLSPTGTADPFYAEFGWTVAGDSNMPVPGPDTLWTQATPGSLTATRPITLTWDNGQGLEFRRTISIDDRYMFTVRQEVMNKTGAPVTLYPYGLISRHGTPQTLGYYILHEGLIGYLGNQGLQEYTYKSIGEKKNVAFDVTNGWLGITDKYWAATLVPPPSARLKARFSSGEVGKLPAYQADYLMDPVTVAPGATVSSDSRLFAGAKEVHTINSYNEQLGLNHFDLLIDWGWFYFITKPLFLAIDWLYHLVGNFGIAILIVTVLIKIAFFPLANKSYASMAKMKAVQPQIMALRERYAADKTKQQQAMMELYRNEKINPLAGCLPIAVQIPVFFSLYKVLFVTIEMRHAPFFGWIHDLSAPDPTNLFNLFGLIPYDPTLLPMIGPYLHLGIWPLIMGVTMWAQMKLNPAPPDPTQQVIFNWMPVIFTFMLASFPAGLVIYWAWNNTLSVAQQAVIMRRHGAKIELWDNIKALFGKGSAGSAPVTQDNQPKAVESKKKQKAL
jgi:YidC/Oxa1 family membrane protein insertase